MAPKTILVTNRTNIRYFSGFSGTNGYAVLHGKKGFLFTDARYNIVAKNILPKNWRLIETTNGFDAAWKYFIKVHNIKSVEYEGGSVTVDFFRRLKKISIGVFLHDIGTALDEKRIIKTKEELKKIIEAQRITDEVFIIIKKWLSAGVSERAVAWKIQYVAHELGADGISFPPIVGINEHSASPHHQNTDRKLKRGDLILIDMGVVYRGYCSDMTRMLFAKSPNGEQANVYQTVLEGQIMAQRAIHAGVRGDQIDSVARDYISKKGFGKYFTHSLGHGVGLEIHELPNLSQKYKNRAPLPADTVVTIEPGIYLPGKFGVRIEDMVQVKKNGVRNLTLSPKELKSSVIRL